MYQLETERLLLRPLLHQDLATICEYMQDVDIYNNTLLIPYPYRQEDAESFLAMVYEQYTRASDYVFAMVAITDSCFILAFCITRPLAGLRVKCVA